MSDGAAVITISSSRANGGGAVDTAGPALAAFAERVGARVVGRELIPDSRGLIAERLRFWCGQEGCRLVLTTGGTGLSPDDVTPEATAAVIDRPAPGIAEAMRLASREHTDKWMLSRGLAGVCGEALIINFPGSARSIDQAGAAIEAALPHALALLGRVSAGRA